MSTSVGKRLEYGFQAWQTTLGYISKYHSPDVLLKVHASPGAQNNILWGATLTWGHNLEEVKKLDSIGAALDRLWVKVAAHHKIFVRDADAYRQPSDYHDEDWLDIPTQDMLHRLLWTTSTALKAPWSMIIVYQPSEIASLRVQMRLLLEDDPHPIGGRGQSLLEASRSLFRNAAPVFARHTGVAVQPNKDFE